MEAGFGILREIGEILDDSSLDTSDRATNLRLVDASNRFYTVIPHHFSVRARSYTEHAALRCSSDAVATQAVTVTALALVCVWL